MTGQQAGPPDTPDRQEHADGAASGSVTSPLRRWLVTWATVLAITLIVRSTGEWLEWPTWAAWLAAVALSASAAFCLSRRDRTGQPSR